MDKRLRILVVDDDEVLRKMIVSILAKCGEVHAVECGTEAITFLHGQTVDLIFSDVCMPSGTGIDLLDWVQKNHPAVPVVLVTGNSPLSEPEMVLRGADQVIKKPFRMKALLDVVERVRQVAS